MTAIFFMTLMACGGTPREAPQQPTPKAPSPPQPVADAAATTPDAAIEDAGVADAAIPAKPARASQSIITIQFINLSVSAATLEIDADGHGVFEIKQNDLELENEQAPPIEANVSDKTIAMVRDTLARSRFCAIKPPDDNVMIWTSIRVDLPGSKCELKMAPKALRQRHPDIARVIHALEAEICAPKRTCPRSAMFD